MARKRILLTRLWDGHPAGTIVEEEDYTVDSMVRKKYGTIVPAKPERPELPGNPPVETAMLTIVAETATAGPQASKRRAKKGAAAVQPPAVTPENSTV